MMYVIFLLCFTIVFCQNDIMKSVDYKTLELFMNSLSDVKEYTFYIDIIDDSSVDIFHLNKMISVMEHHKDIKFNCVITNAVGIIFHLVRHCDVRYSFENSMIGIGNKNLISNILSTRHFSLSDEIIMITDILREFELTTCSSLNIDIDAFRSKLPWITNNFIDAYNSGFSDSLIEILN